MLATVLSLPYFFVCFHKQKFLLHALKQISPLCIQLGPNNATRLLTQCSFSSPLCMCVYVNVCVCVCVLIKVLYQFELLMCVFISRMCSFIGELDLS